MTDPNGAAIYGAPWIPSKKPSHVSMNIPAPAGSVMGIGTVTIPTDELIFFRGVGVAKNHHVPVHFCTSSRSIR